MLRSHRRQRPLTDNKEKPQPHSGRFMRMCARTRCSPYHISKSNACVDQQFDVDQPT